MTVRPIMNLSLNAFIRLYSLEPSKLVGEVGRRMQQPGGYDFYKILTDAIRARISGASPEEIENILTRASRSAEVQYNREAYNCFVNRFGNKRSLTEFDGRGEVRLADGALRITVAPTFAISPGERMEVYHIWATQRPQMDRSKASVACYLMQEAFKRSAPNYEYKLFDAVDGRVFSTINNTTPVAVDSVARTIANYASM